MQRTPSICETQEQATLCAGAVHVSPEKQNELARPARLALLALNRTNQTNATDQTDQPLSLRKNKQA